MISEEKFADLRVKELELIQGAISRMASYAATNRNYCLTITTAICGFALSTKISYIALFSIIPGILFFYLEGRFLRSERQFRSLYDKRRSESWTSMPSFDFGFSSDDHKPLHEALFSWSILPFYLLLTIGFIFVFAAIKLSI